MPAIAHFLRNNFKPKEWLGAFCMPRQHNRIANILQDWQGYGCWIDKPLSAEGRGWRVVFDGSSDIPIPPGVDDPWLANTKDQFRVKRVPTLEKFYVKGGLRNGKCAFDLPAAGADGIGWRDDTDSDTNPDGYPGEISYAVPIADGETITLWAGTTAEEAIGWQLFVLGEGATSTDAEAWMVSKFGEAEWIIVAVAEIERDDTATPKIAIDQLDDAWMAYAPVTLDHVAVLGGVWQDVTDAETTIYAPEDGDITWPADTDTSHDSASSVPFDCSEGGRVIWARLDLSSVTPSFKLMCLAVGADPTYAADVYWQKIATVTAVGEPDADAEPPDDPDDFDPAQVTLAVQQHHSGSIERHPVTPGVLDAYSVDTALGSSTAEPPTTADWFAVPVGGGTVRYIDSDTFTASASGDGNTVVFEDQRSDRMFLVILSGQFKIASTGSGVASDPKYSIQEVALCTSDGGSPATIAGNTIHPLCARKWHFVQHPTFTSADDPPVIIPDVLEGYGPFSIATLIVPADDLTNNTLSVWARGRGVIDAELVIVELPDARWDT